MFDYTMEQVLHMNHNYSVVFVPEEMRRSHPNMEGGKVLGNFMVVHNIFRTVEQYCESYPAALSIAEYFNKQLETKSYMDTSDIGGHGMIHSGGSLEEFMEECGMIGDFTPEDDDDDGGMLN